MSNQRRAACLVFALSVFSALAFTASAASHHAAPPKASLNLGDTNADLIFTPLNPCRIFDTRLGGGFMAGGVTRGFKVAGTTAFALQGGTVGGCGVPSGATSVLINFVAVAPDGIGNLKGSAYPNPIPTVGSILNYQLLNPTLNIANAVAFPICDPTANVCDFDMTLFTNGGGTHVVADVLGYFKRFPTEQTITSVGAGTGLTGGGSSGSVILGIDTTGASSGQELSFNGSGVNWTTPNAGTITGVTAGAGLNGGGTSGNVSLAAAFTASGGMNGIAATVARGDHTHYARTAIVSPVGTATQNGTALLTVLSGINGLASSPALLKIEPGIYDIGTLTMTMKPYLDIEGSGEGVTKITHHGGDLFNPTVEGADNVEVRFLTIESTGGSAYSGALHTNGKSPHFLHATLVATGATSYSEAAFLEGVASLAFTDVTISASGAGAVGLNRTFSASSTTTLDRVTITSSASGGSGTAYGIIANGAVSADQVRISAVNTAGQAIGVENQNGGNFIIADSTIAATGSGSVVVWGIRDIDASLTLTNSTVTAGGGNQTLGVENSGATTARTVKIDTSRITGTTYTVFSSGTYTTRIAHSRLDGGAMSGTITCAFVYDENYVAYTSTCP